MADLFVLSGTMEKDSIQRMQKTCSRRLNGSTRNRSSPVPVSGLQSSIKLSAGMKEVSGLRAQLMAEQPFFSRLMMGALDLHGGLDDETRHKPNNSQIQDRE